MNYDNIVDGHRRVHMNPSVYCKDNIVNAVMAQSVAHLIGSEEVTGSIPVNSLKKPLILQGLFVVFYQFTISDSIFDKRLYIIYK